MSASRLYRIVPIKGGRKFVCTLCNFQVLTTAYRPENGNVRTQAASALAKHALLEHPRETGWYPKTA